MDNTDTGDVTTQDDATVVADAIADTSSQDDATVVADAVESTTGDETKWSFAEGVDGEGEAPEWFKADKYKTVSDQAKAYKDLEGRFGSFTGAPEEFAPAELREELKEMGIEINTDDPLMEKAIAFAKETNMNQEGFNQMVNLYAETMAAETMALEDYKAEQFKSLGNNAETRINNLNAWANANLSPDMVEGFQGLAQSADSIKTLERLVAMTRSAPISPENAQPASSKTEADIKAMQFEKDDYGNRRIATDPEFKAKFEKLANEFYGTEDHVVTIG